MADEEEGMLSQADLDALIAAAQAQPSAEDDLASEMPEEETPAAPEAPEAFRRLRAGGPAAL